MHDISYIYGKEKHESKGAAILEGLNIPFANIVDNHGYTPSEYKEIMLCHDEDIPKALALLWEADMMVDMTGKKAVRYKQRLKGIIDHYGLDSRPYRICKETIDWLLEK